MSFGDFGDWSQFAAVLVALVALIWQQRKTAIDGDRREQRIELKLRIFYILEDQDRDEPEIVQALSAGQPLRQVDVVEVKKALYEMLSESTVRFTSEGKYKPRERSPRPV